jgi:hypothetical protein
MTATENGLWAVMTRREQAGSRLTASTEGESLRDAGLLLASRSKQDRIDRLELRFLDRLAEAGSGTLDLAEDDLHSKCPDGGKWRGSIPMRLARDGLIIATGVQKSKRRARHAGLLTIWSIRDAAAVNARRHALRMLLGAS